MKKALVVAAALVLCAALAGAQTSSETQSASGALTLSAAPAITFPLTYWGAGLPPGFYQLTLGAAIDAEYRLGFLPLLFAKAGITYRRAPLTVGPVLSLIEASAGVGARFSLTPTISVKPYVAAGYDYGILATDFTTEKGGAWMARAGVDLQLGFFAPIGIVIGAAVVWDWDVFLGIQGSVGASYTFGAPAAAKPRVEKPEKTKPQELAPEETPKVETKPTAAAGGLTLEPAFDYVFPAFRDWYGNNPLGTLTITNGGKDAVTNVQVSFLMKQYMDSSWTSDVIARIEPGKSATVPIKALFTQKMLDITSSIRSIGELTVDYKVGSEAKQARLSENVRIQGRNEMTWADDDQRAAAFVTSSDPAVNAFARNVVAAVKGSGSKAINGNLSMAMAIHEAVRLFPMAYIPDPKTPYADLVTKKDALDRLQYPRETLQYKGGDCDDLSILYCALLESIAVKTAFITIPGHIFMAISTGLTPDQARQKFKRADELIFEGDIAWIPIEVTALGEKDDFLEAWLLGAKEWRENKARNQARLFPMETAWQLYEPVSLPPDNAPPPVAPGANTLVDRYQKVTIRFLDREMYDLIAAYQKQITDSKEDPKAINRLGVLYASYGRYNDAKVWFKKASDKSKTYALPLVNLGMIALEEGEFQAASGYYESARKLEPKNPYALLGYARANHELENYGSVRTAYDELKKVDPDLAQKFAYLDLRGDEAARAANISKAKEETLWAQDK